MTMRNMERMPHYDGIHPPHDHEANCTVCAQVGVPFLSATTIAPVAAHSVKCPACDGYGTRPHRSKAGKVAPCKVCNRTGIMHEPDSIGAWLDLIKKPNPPTPASPPASPWWPWIPTEPLTPDWNRITCRTIPIPGIGMGTVYSAGATVH